MFLNSFPNFQGLSPLPYRIDEDELNELEAQEDENNNEVSVCMNLFKVFEKILGVASLKLFIT